MEQVQKQHQYFQVKNFDIWQKIFKFPFYIGSDFKDSIVFYQSLLKNNLHFKIDYQNEQLLIQQNLQIYCEKTKTPTFQIQQIVTILWETKEHQIFLNFFGKRHLIKFQIHFSEELDNVFNFNNYQKLVQINSKINKDNIFEYFICKEEEQDQDQEIEQSSVAQSISPIPDLVFIDFCNLIDNQQSESPIKKRWKKNNFINEESIELQKLFTENKEQNLCSICYLDFSNTTGAIQECGHVFCFDCIKDWLLEQPVCPLCKVPASFLVKSENGKEVERIKIKEILKNKQFDVEQDDLQFSENFCYKCWQENDQHVLLVCDYCEQKCCHTYCLQPQLSVVPNDDWFCDYCVRNFGLIPTLPIAQIQFNQNQPRTRAVSVRPRNNRWRNNNRIWQNNPSVSPFIQRRGVVTRREQQANLTINEEIDWILQTGFPSIRQSQASGISSAQQYNQRQFIITDEHKRRMLEQEIQDFINGSLIKR